MHRFAPRYDDDGWFKVRGVEVTTSIFLAAATAVSVVLYVVSEDLFVRPLELTSEGVRSGQIWRLFTWPLVNPISLWIILSIAMMYLIGGDIERELGKRRFAWLIGALVIVPALAGVAFESFAMVGINSVVSPLFVVLVLWRPTARTFFDIPLWVLVVVFEVLQLLQILDARKFGAPIGGVLAFWAVGLAVAAVMTRSLGLTEFHQIPRIPLPGFVTGDPYAAANRAREKAQRSRSRGRRPAARKPGGRRAPAEVVPIRPEARLDRDSQADMDALLDKISEQGIDSLTPPERARLDELSRRLRGE